MEFECKNAREHEMWTHRVSSLCSSILAGELCSSVVAGELLFICCS